MKKILFVTVFVCVIFLLASCSTPQKESAKTVYAMGTIMELKAYGENGEAALDAAEKEIMRLDALLSRGNHDSEVARINSLGTYKASQDTINLISTSLDLSRSTDGAFDITVTPLSDLWGFYTQDYYIPSDYEISETLKKVGSTNVSVEGETVNLKNDAQIDLGGIAKGYLSGRITDIFRENGARSGIVSLGGNVDTVGTKPDGALWKIGIQHPDGGIIGTVAISDKAVITSGGYRRFFEKNGQIYHHIIDPETGHPSESGLRSVTIIGENSTLADGLSTAVFVMGLDKGAECLKSYGGFDAVIMTDEDDIYITKGIENFFESDYEFKVLE